MFPVNSNPPQPSTDVAIPAVEETGAMTTPLWNMIVGTTRSCRRALQPENEASATTAPPALAATGAEWFDGARLPGRPPAP